MGHPNNSEKYARFNIPIPGPGAPRKYNTPEELTKLIEDYFASCWEEDWIAITKDGKTTWIQQFDHNGNPIMKLRKRPTVTGLALALGFTTRHSLINYQKKDEFADIIESAKLVVEHYYENGGVQGEIHPATTIFALKNFGWTDVIQIKNTDTSDRLTADEIAAQIDAAKRRLNKETESK